MAVSGGASAQESLQTAPGGTPGPGPPHGGIRHPLRAPRPSWHAPPLRLDPGRQPSRHPWLGLGLAGCGSPTTLAAASSTAGSAMSPQAIGPRDDLPMPRRRPRACTPCINIVHPNLVSLVLYLPVSYHSVIPDDSLQRTTPRMVS